MTLHLPKRLQDQMFYDHDMRTDTIDWEYRFRSVLLPSYWKITSRGVAIYRANKGMQKRRFGKSFTSLNF